MFTQNLDVLASRHRHLRLLFLAVTALPLLLLLYGVRMEIAASRQQQDVNLSGSLRFRSLWLYGATHNSSRPPLQPMLTSMRHLRDDLRTRYPDQVAATDAAWKPFTRALELTGQVDWTTANTMRVAANTLTNTIEQQARQQSRHAVLLFLFGAGGMVVCAWRGIAILLRLGRAEVELYANERRLTKMIENLPAGAVYVQGQNIRINKGVETITGYLRTELTTLDAWFEAVYKEQAAEMRAFYEQAKSEGCRQVQVVSILHRDGANRYVEFAAYADTNGEVWLLHDVTERLVTDEKFKVLFEQLSDAHLLFDETGIIDCNAAAIQMLNCRDKAEILSLHPAVLSPEYQPDGRRSPEKFMEMDRIARERGCHRFEWLHQKRDGEVFPVEATLTPVILTGKSVMLVVWHDLTERKLAEMAVQASHARLEQINDEFEQQIVLVSEQAVQLEAANAQLEAMNTRLESLATTDGLTGLKNHRSFQERLGDWFLQSNRYGTPLSLILLDVDQFKQYNDIYGHPAGDEVLRTVARILQQTARITDFVARYGGEEFVLILPETDDVAAITAGERFRAAIEAYPWCNRQVTASFGVATRLLTMSAPTELIAAADRAMYQSKQCGRNCVTHVRNLEEEPDYTASIEAAYADYMTKLLFLQQSSWQTQEAEIAETLTAAYDSTIEGWSKILDVRDHETEGHSQRVTEMTVQMAQMAGLTPEEIIYIKWGALLHDIGKMGIPDHILHKPGPLDDAEWEIMRQHPGLAYEMLFPILFLRPALDIPYCHHEKWDGTGYPRGLKGEEIPLPVRLFSVVDVWDALRSNRPYRKGWSQRKAEQYLKDNAGTHFDPRAVRLFFRMRQQEKKLKRKVDALDSFPVSYDPESEITASDEIAVSDFSA